MKLGVVTASVSRQAGGLFWSVRALVDGISRNGTEVFVCAVEDAWTEVDRAEWGTTRIKTFDGIGPDSFSYAPRLVGELIASNCDLLHVHGLWMYPSIAAQSWARRTGRPYVVSPRGMLDSWALQNSRWKKRIAWALYEAAHVRNAACIHALCHSEVASIRALGLKNPVCVIPNGVALPVVVPGKSKAWGAPIDPRGRVLLSLGRIHPKKNLLALVNAFSLGKANSRIGAEWHLVIAGWDQGGYEGRLKAEVRRHGLDRCIHFPGPMFGTDKAHALENADAFILPSRSEGLPMAVLEAWSYGLPVLMTDGCNLPEGFRSGAADRLPEEAEPMMVSLSDALSRTSTELSDIGKRGRALVERQFAWPDISLEMGRVYQWILGRGARPSTVVQ